LIRQDYRHTYQTERSLKDLNIIKPIFEFLKAKSQAQLEEIQNQVQNETLVSESIDKIQHNEVENISRLAEEKLKWISSKLPVFEKAFEYEQDNLKIREVVRSEMRFKRENKVKAKGIYYLLKILEP